MTDSSETVMNNSGHGPLKAPGFGGIPIFYQLDLEESFTHGAGGYNPEATDDQETWPYVFTTWEQKPRVTARELSITHLIDVLTDKPNWNIDVFDEEVIARWRQEALLSPLISDNCWNWCIAELLDKAKSFNDSGYGHILVLDTGSCVCKSDTAVSSATQIELREGVAPLIAIYNAENSWLSGLGQGQQVQNLVDPSLFPLVLGKSRVLIDGGQVDLNTFLNSYGCGEISPSHPDERLNHSEVCENLERRGVPFRTDEEANLYRYSTNFQWLPCEVEFIGESGTDVCITSYINNLHPDQHRSLYLSIEKLVSLAIKPWNDCLIYGKRGRVPIRIRTYGVKLQPGSETDYKYQGPRIFEHPEPGTAFSYQDWKNGKNGKAIINWTFHGHPGRYPQKPDHAFYTIALQDTFREQGLQIVVKITNIELTPDEPSYAGDDWHVNGLLNDHIVATAVYYYEVENVTNSRLSFRQKTWFDEDEYEWKSEDLEALASVFGVDTSSLLPSEVPLKHTSVPGTQELGSISTRQGRLVTWPNALEHRVESFTLADQTRPGHQRSIVLHLVDPHYRLCSTRNVPPQRHDWWAEAAKASLAADGLPQEVAGMIMKETNEWPIGMEEARQIRLELSKEHAWGAEATKELMSDWWGLAFHGRY